MGFQGYEIFAARRAVGLDSRISQIRIDGHAGFMDHARLIRVGPTNKGLQFLYQRRKDKIKYKNGMIGYSGFNRRWVIRQFQRGRRQKHDTATIESESDRWKSDRSSSATGKPPRGRDRGESKHLKIIDFTRDGALLRDLPSGMA